MREGGEGEKGEIASEGGKGEREGGGGSEGEWVKRE